LTPSRKRAYRRRIFTLAACRVRIILQEGMTIPDSAHSVWSNVLVMSCVTLHRTEQDSGSDMSARLPACQ
jgi:hypothetical protein